MLRKVKQEKKKKKQKKTRREIRRKKKKQTRTLGQGHALPTSEIQQGILRKKS